MKEVLGGITQRAAAEPETRDVQPSEESLFELASAWRWETDPELRLTHLSQGYDERAGLSWEESLGRRFDQLWHVSESAEPYVSDRQPFRNLCASWNHSKTGQERWFALSAEPLIDSRGKFKGYRGVTADFTAHVQSAAGVLVAARATEQSNRAIIDFLTNLSHELRTSLNAIVGLSDVMRGQHLGPQDNERYLEYAEDIHVSARHLLDVVNTILDLSQIEAGKVKLDEEELEVAPLVEICSRMVREHADKAGIELSAKVAENLPRLRADRVKVKQIILNLLSNALKFTPEDGQVVVMARPGAEGGMEIEVHDTGVGIRPSEISKVIGRFSQSDQACARAKEGVGLGLSIVKSLVDLHGGILRILSEENAGTRALVVFPEERMVREGGGSKP